MADHHMDRRLVGTNGGQVHYCARQGLVGRSYGKVNYESYQKRAFSSNT